MSERPTRPRKALARPSGRCGPQQDHREAATVPPQLQTWKGHSGVVSGAVMDHVTAVVNQDSTWDGQPIRSAFPPLGLDRWKLMPEALVNV